MNKKTFAIILAFVMLLATTSPAFANNGNGNGSGNTDEESGESTNTDSAAPDPGVSSGQDDTKTSTIRWILPHGDTFIIDDEEVNIVLDWESLDITSEREVGNGNVSFIGIGGSGGGDDSSSTSCGGGNGRGNCNGNGNGNNNGNGNGNGGGGPLPSSDCGSVWVTPGEISAWGRQIDPEYAVVINQDPEETGVTIEWHISIAPTTVNYEKWKIVGQRMVACVEGNQNRNGSGHDNDPEGEQYRNGCGHDNCGCPNGWSAVIEHIWACSVTSKTYKESMDELIAGASLTLDSRAWIGGELAAAYPGATLQHPDWGIGQTPQCVWNGDVCTWTFTANLPIVDPGWYDIKLSGATSGTRVSPARSFEITSGEFGVFLLDNTAMTQ